MGNSNSSRIGKLFRKCICSSDTVDDIPNYNHEEIVYPSEDDWYMSGKLKFPKTSSTEKILDRRCSEKSFASYMKIRSRRGTRLVKDITDNNKRARGKSVDIIQFNGTKVTKCLPRGVSKESIDWFEKFMDKYNIKIEHFANSGAEKLIQLHNNNYIKVDGWCEEHNLVFEYHGSFFHGDPDNYRRCDLNPLTKTRNGELYCNTRNRDLDILNSGYNLCTIWGYKKVRLATFFITKIRR